MNEQLAEYIAKYGTKSQPKRFKNPFTRLTRFIFDNITVTNKNK